MQAISRIDFGGESILKGALACVGVVVGLIKCAVERTSNRA
ncbi:MAG TPA: hypothetical protein VFH88_09140 [Candidatus Krumholzibacteria bacterium]|nr:hypothetical protein [Candidatus Krumholzibacteria bacterium]